MPSDGSLASNVYLLEKPLSSYDVVISGMVCSSKVTCIPEVEFEYATKRVQFETRLIGKYVSSFLSVLIPF